MNKIKEKNLNDFLKVIDEYLQLPEMELQSKFDNGFIKICVNGNTLTNRNDLLMFMKFEITHKKQIDYICDILLDEFNNIEKTIYEEVGLDPEHNDVPCFHITLFATLIMKLIDMGYCKEYLCNTVIDCSNNYPST